MKSDFYFLIIETIVSIITLFIVTKLIGRKQISQLNIFDFIIGITIGNIAAEMAVNKEVDLVGGIVAILIYAFSSLLVSFVTSKSIKARRFFTGVPIIVVENGKLLEDSLKKIHFDINDFLEECRVSGYFDLSQIEYAIMESNGQISFLPKSKYTPLTPNDMKIKTPYKGLTANLVIDGKIMHENLNNIGKDEKWLLKRLENNGYDRLDDVLLVICDTDEKITIYEKNQGVTPKKVLE